MPHILLVNTQFDHYPWRIKDLLSWQQISKVETLLRKFIYWQVSDIPKAWRDDACKLVDHMCTKGSRDPHNLSQDAEPKSRLPILNACHGMPQRPLSSFGAQQLNLNESRYQRSFACDTCSFGLSNPLTYPYSWRWLDAFPASYNPCCEAQAVWWFQHWLLRVWFRYNKKSVRKTRPCMISLWPESTAMQCIASLFGSNV